MKHKHYNILMEHPLGTEALRALLYSVGLPRTAEEEQIFADLAHAYFMVAVDISDFPKLWVSLYCLDEQYLRTNVLTADAAKVMSRLFFERYFLTIEIGDLTCGSPADAEAKHCEARSCALHDRALDTNKCHQHGRELRLRTLQVAAKRIEAALKGAKQE